MFVAPAGTRCALAATRKTKVIPRVNDEVLTATAIEARYVLRPSEVPEFSNRRQIATVIELRDTAGT
ncbi:hypothetical protein MPHO_04740 [Mycolicibacterium phocaicum]|uniref:Uncharacterized protein n=1 Tax=Mycolicibacterium phocaicum TaxID=319706 RepID=A0A7I7ZIB3_9MYCO|nr:hypothetical protein C1S79_14555 [Mycolicibacterium phocaicum]BBZ53482.1 hypothetical protein MPHO_04740 [Mycolicibacterium phocaicum]